MALGGHVSDIQGMEEGENMEIRYYKSGLGDSWGAYCVSQGGAYWVSLGDEYHDNFSRGYSVYPRDGLEGVATFLPCTTAGDKRKNDKTLKRHEGGKK